MRQAEPSQVHVPDFRFSRTIVFDVKALYSKSVAQSTVCHSPRQRAACLWPFEHLGVNYGTGTSTPTTQTVFRSSELVTALQRLCRGRYSCSSHRCRRAAPTSRTPARRLRAGPLEARNERASGTSGTSEAAAALARAAVPAARPTAAAPERGRRRQRRSRRRTDASAAPAREEAAEPKAARDAATERGSGTGGSIGQDAGRPTSWKLPPGFPDAARSPGQPDVGSEGRARDGTCSTTYGSPETSRNPALRATQQRAFTDGAVVSTGSTGQHTPRNSMSLVNVGYNGFFTWSNPLLTALEQQALVPILGAEPVELGLRGRKPSSLAACARSPISIALSRRPFPV